jgi:hypothetical protein
MPGGRERFYFSCWPPNDTLDTPHPPRVRALQSQRTADQRDAKRRPSARKRKQEKKRRTAWAKERKLHAKAVSGPPPADPGTTAAAAAAPTAAAAAATATTATAAAVAATYCEAAKATLPTTAAPRAAAEAATRRTRCSQKGGGHYGYGRQRGGSYEPVPACPARQAEAEAPTASRADKRTEQDGD